MISVSVDRYAALVGICPEKFCCTFGTGKCRSFPFLLCPVELFESCEKNYFHVICDFKSECATNFLSHFEQLKGFSLLDCLGMAPE